MTKKRAKLRLARGVDIDIDYVTDSGLILGRKGQGKTYTAAKLIEEIDRAGVQFVVLDPTDVWWGLRSGADGESPGLGVYVFGGNHADVPLEATGGEMIADLLVDTGISVVLSMRGMSKTQQRTFIAQFAERLFRRKGEAGKNTPIHIVIDEADEYVPQRLSGAAARSYDAIIAFIRRGRTSGIGTTLLTQRSAAINKDAISQTEVLIAHQTTGPRDRAALEEWIEANAEKAEADEFRRAVATLSIGEVYIWSPTLLRMFKRVKIGERKTFDSSRTPRVGETPIVPRVLAPVDLDAIAEQMAATVERAKENDPTLLKRRIAELEAQVAADPEGDPEREGELEVALRVAEEERENVREGARRAASNMESVAQSASDLGEDVLHKMTNLASAILESVRTLDRAIDTEANVSAIVNSLPSRPVDWKPEQRAPRIGSGKAGETLRRGSRGEPPEWGADLPKSARAILTALASHGGQRTTTQLQILTGYRPGGAFNNGLGRLRTLGYVTKGQPVTLTGEGAAIADGLGAEPLPSGQALLEYWLDSLELAQREALAVLVDHPDGLTPEDLAARMTNSRGEPYTAGGGAFNNAVGRLRTLELVEKGQPLRLTPEFREAIT